MAEYTISQIKLPNGDICKIKYPAYGNLQNNGTLQISDISIGNGDKLIIADADSNPSNMIARSSISFDGSTKTKALTPKGTWETFLQEHQTVTSTGNQLVWGTSTTIAQIGNTDINITLPANPDTTNTAGSFNNTSDKLFLVGAVNQASSLNTGEITYSSNCLSATGGALSAKSLGINYGTSTDKVTLVWNNTDESLDFVFN